MKLHSQRSDNHARASQRTEPAPTRERDRVDISPRLLSPAADAPSQAAQTFRLADAPGYRPARSGLQPASPTPAPDEEALRASREAVAQANHAASRLGLGPRFLDSLEETRRANPALIADDARWVFAVRVRREIQGGVAAIIDPVARKRLLKLSNRLGLRDFDANLIIAIVQDDARRFPSALPVPSPESHASLRLVRPSVIPSEQPSALAVLARWSAAVGLAGVMAFAAARWIVAADAGPTTAASEPAASR